LAVILAEIIIRVFDLDNYCFSRFRSTITWKAPERWVTNGLLSEKCFIPSSGLGYEFTPNSILGTNSLGMFDKERTVFKPEGIFRIMCVGDSTTATSDYVGMLEALLNKNITGRRFEVLNCGVPGYGAIQYCRTIKDKWSEFSPDMIIIAFCLNDF